MNGIFCKLSHVGEYSAFVLHVYLLSHFSCVQLFVIPWTVAHQALLSMGFCKVVTGNAAT